MLLAGATSATAQQDGGLRMPPVSPGETVLQVTAHGLVKAVPDVAILSTGVSSDGPDAEAARAKNAEIVARLVAAMRKVGVSDAALRTEGLEISRLFQHDKEGEDTNVVIGARAQTRLRVRLTDVKMVSQVLDALVGAGANELNGPVFTFADDAPLKQQARAAAVAAALIQATDYAKPFGLHIARTLRISERATGTSGSGDINVGDGLNDLPQLRSGPRQRTSTVLPGEQEVTADVWIDFALAR